MVNIKMQDGTTVYWQPTSSVMGNWRNNDEEMSLFKHFLNASNGEGGIAFDCFSDVALTTPMWINLKSVVSYKKT